MKRIGSTALVWSAMVLAVTASAARATPTPNGASIEARTFNDCPISTLTVTNNYPTSIVITDAMHPDCIGFANLHSWSFSEDGGATAAVFNNNSNFRFAADLKIEGAGEGEAGLRISPWYGKFVDGRFMANATSGEIACFGGTLPFYSFTGNHGITYVKGTTIRLEVRTYLADDLFDTDPARIQYRVKYNGNTYDSPVLDFGEANPSECDPYHLWGILNDARAGAYFQPRANTGASLTARWSNIEYEVLPAGGTPVANGATLELRTFNDCPISTLTANNAYPALISISDAMDPNCIGFANLHSWSFSEDGGTTAAPYHNNSGFHYFADVTIDGAGEGEGGLRISPWYGKFVDGRFMTNVTSGEIACFGGALPFYSFTANHGITYARGTPIRLDVIYRANELVEAEPATIRYRVVYNGTTYDSPELPFGEQNPSECDPYHTWGMLNDGRVGAYFQPRANTGAELAATWSNIRYSTCTDPVDVGFTFHPRRFNTAGKGKYVTARITPDAPLSASDIDVESIRLNGLPVDEKARVRVVRRCHDRDDDKDRHWGGKHKDRHHRRCPWTLVVKFDRDAFAGTVTPGSAVPVLISGLIGNQCFEETVHIRVRAPRMKPHDNDLVAPGSVVELEWDPQEVEGGDLALASTSDDGQSWTVEVGRVPNTGRFSWRAPSSTAGPMRLALAQIDEVDEDGVVVNEEVASSGTFRVAAPTGVSEPAVAFALRGVSPNPAQGSFTVSFSLPGSEEASLRLFDVSGRLVAERNIGALGKGSHRVTLGEAERLRPGLYLVRMSSAGRTVTTRVAIVQ